MFSALRDPHLGNGEGEADAALRLVRLHGVAGGEQEGQRLPDGGIENYQRRGKFQRHGGGIPAFVGRLLHQAGGRDEPGDLPGGFPQSSEPGHGGGVDHFHGKYSSAKHPNRVTTLSSLMMNGGAAQAGGAWYRRDPAQRSLSACSSRSMASITVR